MNVTTAMKNLYFNIRIALGTVEDLYRRLAGKSRKFSKTSWLMKKALYQIKGKKNDLQSR